MEGSTKQITSVSNNMEKQQAYRQQIGRYSLAMKNGFYYEALLITYAMIEDRLRSFLYYIGAIREFDSVGLDVAKTRKSLRRLYFGSDEAANNKSLQINQYAPKRALISKTLALIDEPKPDEGYLRVLTEEYVRCLDIGGLRSVLSETETWCEYRNEIIHGLLNKNVMALDGELSEKVAQGMCYARFIDSQVKALKRRNAVRKYLRL